MLILRGHRQGNHHALRNLTDERQVLYVLAEFTLTERSSNRTLDVRFQYSALI